MEEETETPVIKGSFLIASPHLRDPNFRQTVVLMCEHGPGGSLGLVVNRRTEHHIMEVLPQTTGLHERAGLVYSGGRRGAAQRPVLAAHPGGLDLSGNQTAKTR